MNLEQRGRRGRESGQALVEYAMLVPMFLLILFGMMEFGFVFQHNLTLEYATREGARTGAALANGGSANCPGGAFDPDPYVIAAVERVLTSPGSPIANNIASVTQIQIYAATSAGVPVSAAKTNTWTYTGSLPTNPLVGAVRLLFNRSGPQNWTACQRNNGTPPVDSIGVSVTYTYTLVTPMSAIFRFFGPGAGPATYAMNDRSVMALNPTN